MCDYYDHQTAAATFEFGKFGVVRNANMKYTPLTGCPSDFVLASTHAWTLRQAADLTMRTLGPLHRVTLACEANVLLPERGP